MAAGGRAMVGVPPPGPLDVHSFARLPSTMCHDASFSLALFAVLGMRDGVSVHARLGALG